MSFPEFVVKNWVDTMKKSFDFAGKTTRKEYWSMVLANFLLVLLISFFVPFLLGLFQLLTVFQGIAALIRRFRDADVTPWAILFILPIYVVVFMKSRE